MFKIMFKMVFKMEILGGSAVNVVHDCGGGSEVRHGGGSEIN